MVRYYRRAGFAEIKGSPSVQSLRSIPINPDRASFAAMGPGKCTLPGPVRHTVLPETLNLEGSEFQANGHNKAREIGRGQAGVSVEPQHKSISGPDRQTHPWAQDDVDSSLRFYNIELVSRHGAVSQNGAAATN